MKADEPTKSAPKLTDRIVDVVTLISHGKTNEEISMILNISSRAVARRLDRAWQLTDTHNRTQLACKALREGWIR